MSFAATRLSRTLSNQDFSLVNARRSRILILSILCVSPLIFIQFWTVEPHRSGFNYTIHGLGYAASAGWPFPNKTTYRSFHSGEIFEVRFSRLSLQTNVGILFALFLATLFSLNYITNQKHLQISDLIAILSAIAVLIVTYQRCQLWTEQNHWSLYYGTAGIRPAYPDWPFWIALAVLGVFVYSAIGAALRQQGKRSGELVG